MANTISGDLLGILGFTLWLMTWVQALSRAPTKFWSSLNTSLIRSLYFLWTPRTFSTNWEWIWKSKHSIGKFIKKNIRDLRFLHRGLRYSQDPSFGCGLAESELNVTCVVEVASRVCTSWLALFYVLLRPSKNIHSAAYPCDSQQSAPQTCSALYQRSCKKNLQMRILTMLLSHTHLLYKNLLLRLVSSSNFWMTFSMYSAMSCSWSIRLASFL